MKEKTDKLENASKNLSSFRSIVLDIIIVAIIFTVVWLVYKELNKDTVIIETFQVPTDLEKYNITGQAIANKLIDQIENIKANADTSFKKIDVTTVYYDTQLEMVIPGSGISLKSLMNNVKNFLGKNQMRISGEVVLNKKLFLTIRVKGSPSKTFSGELDELDSLLADASKYILKYTHPYLLAYYLYYDLDHSTDEALEMIKYSLANPPYDDDPMAYTLDGYIKWEEKKFEESIELYKKAIELDPKYVDAYDGWAYSLYEMKKYDEAAEIYKKALSLEPNNTFTNHYIGMNLEAQGMHDSAIMYYERSIQLDPAYDEVYVSYGDLLFEQKKYDQAAEMYNKAIDLERREFDAYTGLGKVYTEQNKLDEALSVLKKSIELNPENAFPYFDAGIVLIKMNKFKEANDMYSKALKLDSANTEFYSKIGSDLAEQSKVNEAVEIYKNAIKYIPSDSTIFTEKIKDIRKEKVIPGK